jgi:hypothetical protein
MSGPVVSQISNEAVSCMISIGVHQGPMFTGWSSAGPIGSIGRWLRHVNLVRFSHIHKMYTFDFLYRIQQIGTSRHEAKRNKCNYRVNRGFNTGKPGLQEQISFKQIDTKYRVLVLDRGYSKSLKSGVYLGAAGKRRTCRLEPYTLP